MAALGVRIATLRWAVSLLVAFGGGCSSPKAATSFTFSELAPNYWRFEGRISSLSQDSLRRLVDTAKIEAHSTLEVTSIGGDVVPAIEMAEIVRTKDIRVVVDKICASACAQYLFLGSERRSVKPDSLVLFHGSPELLREEYSASGNSHAADLYNRGASMEREFYDRVGVSRDFFELAPLGLQPLCLLEVPGKDKLDPERYQLYTKFVAYTPSQASLEALNVHVTGYWPASAREFLELLRTLPLNSKFSASYVELRPGALHKAHRASRLKLAACSA